MERGRILQAGTAVEISQCPANAFVAAFTDTNLASDGDGGQIAFDPWRVSVAHEPTGEEYEWRGRVRDIASMGAFTRLTLDVAEIPSLLADIPGSCEIDDCDFGVGDTVFARVSPNDVRPVRSSEPSAPPRTEEAKREEDKPPVAVRKRNLLSGVRNFLRASCRALRASSALVFRSRRCFAPISPV